MSHTVLEEHLDEHCPNCRERHDAKFFSLFVDEFHYVVGDCAHCDYRIEIPAHDLGGGLFSSDGSTVTERFRKANTEHMRERLARR